MFLPQINRIRRMGVQQIAALSPVVGIKVQPKMEPATLAATAS